jgi:hypothetical protein
MVWLKKVYTFNVKPWLVRVEIVCLPSLPVWTVTSPLFNWDEFMCDVIPYLLVTRHGQIPSFCALSSTDTCSSSSRILSYHRSATSSKTSFPQSAIWNSFFPFPVPSRFVTSSSFSCHLYTSSFFQ